MGCGLCTPDDGAQMDEVSRTRAIDLPTRPVTKMLIASCGRGRLVRSALARSSTSCSAAAVRSSQEQSGRRSITWNIFGNTKIPGSGASFGSSAGVADMSPIALRRFVPTTGNSDAAGAASPATSGGGDGGGVWLSSELLTGMTSAPVPELASCIPGSDPGGKPMGTEPRGGMPSGTGA